MNSNTKENCLSYGQATVCVKNEGVVFEVRLFGSIIDKKIIPYKDIVLVDFRSSFLFFYILKIITLNDPENCLYIGCCGRSASGVNLKHNWVSVPFWKEKKWRQLALLITEKVLEHKI